MPVALTENNQPVLDWDCAKAGTIGQDSKCTSTSDCTHGLHCHNRNSTFVGDECIPWCKEGDGCGALAGCKFISVNVGGETFDAQYNGIKYGACDIL